MKSMGMVKWWWVANSSLVFGVDTGSLELVFGFFETWVFI